MSDVLINIGNLSSGINSFSVRSSQMALATRKVMQENPNAILLGSCRQDNRIFQCYNLPISSIDLANLLISLRPIESHHTLVLQIDDQFSSLTLESLNDVLQRSFEGASQVNVIVLIENGMVKQLKQFPSISGRLRPVKMLPKGFQSIIRD